MSSPATIVNRDAERLAFAMFVRGLTVLPIAAVGLRWPESASLLAVVAGGGVVGTLGVFEIAAGTIGGTPRNYRAYSFAHGAVSITLGVLTACIPVATPRNAITLSVTWLAISTIFAAVLATRRTDWRERIALISWSAFNGGCGAVLHLLAPSNTETLLLLTTGYLALLSLTELAAAFWVRRWMHLPSLPAVR